MRLRCSASVIAAPGPCAPHSWLAGVIFQFCVPACCGSGVSAPGISFWKQVQRHLIVDENGGFWFLESSIPSYFPALPPKGLITRDQCQELSAAAPGEGGGVARVRGSSGCGSDASCH